MLPQGESRLANTAVKILVTPPHSADRALMLQLLQIQRCWLNGAQLHVPHTTTDYRTGRLAWQRQERSPLDPGHSYLRKRWILACQCCWYTLAAQAQAQTAVIRSPFMPQCACLRCEMPQASAWLVTQSIILVKHAARCSMVSSLHVMPKGWVSSRSGY